MECKISDRASAVLKAVVEGYIEKSEPIGAEVISSQYNFGLCAASIRNVLGDLESRGYLTQPHISAGRVPSDKGFRYYAQSLVERIELPENQARDIKRATVGDDFLELADFLGSVSRTLSNLSAQAGLAGVATSGSAPIRKVQFVKISNDMTLAVVVATNGEIQRYVIKTRDVFTQDVLDKITNYYNEKFTYLNLAQARRLLMKKLQREENCLDALRTAALEVAEKLVKQQQAAGAGKIYLDGASNLLNNTENPADLAGIKALFAAIDEKSMLAELLDDCLKSDGIYLVIGSESEIGELADYTVVAHPFSGLSGMAGAVGIIGNKRMNYGHVMALVAYTARSVSGRLTCQSIGEEN